MKFDTRPETKKKLKEFKSYLERKGLLEEVDSLALDMIEITYDNWLNATEFLLKNGSTFEGHTREGDLVQKPFPQVKQQLDAQNQLTKLLKEFGGTTSSRKKVTSSVKEENDDNPLSEFFNTEKR